MTTAIQEKIKKINYKNFLKEIKEIATIILVFIQIFGMVFYSVNPAEAATYTFSQSNWSGGATSTTNDIDMEFKLLS